MNSFAFWCKKDGRSSQPATSSNAGQNPIDVMMHFNLWIEYDKSDAPPYLDVGIMIEHIDLIEKMYFYMPFKIVREKIADLGCVLKDQKVLNAIFHESYSVTSPANSKKVEVKNANSLAFFMYSLDVQNDVKVSNEYSGSIIEINCDKSELNHIEKTYFRFRVECPADIDLIKERQPSNIFLQSAISINCYIDFRFNDIRSLDDTLYEIMHESSMHNLNFYKIHFLLLTRADIELIAAGNERQLEKDIWKPYMDFCQSETIVANHWKIGLNEHCVIYIKLKISRCNFKTIGCYLLVLAIITISLNLISSFFYNKISDRNDSYNLNQLQAAEDISRIESGGSQ